LSSTTPPHRKRIKPQRPGRKLLGLDLGERRIGVAVTDDLGMFAFPLAIIDLTRSSLAEVARIASEQRVDGIVVGIPMNMRGDEGFQARAAREMARQIEQLVDVPIVYADERLTSYIADQALASRGVKPRQRKAQRDAIAAAVMLQGYMDAHPLARASHEHT
jgi:putative Holliday junction resolvase